MYKSPKVSHLHQDKINLTYPTSIGLKQDDVLSTILFSIYINDLPWRFYKSIFRYYNEMPYLDDTKTYNLLFADDLAIFSLSKVDLQKIYQC